LFVLLLSCKEKQYNKTVNTSVKVDTLYKQLSDNLHKFKLFYIIDYSKPDIIKCEKIIITNFKDGVKVQIIKIDTIEIYKKNIYFSIDDDVNFDGYKDICLLNYEGNYNNSYYFWLFDKKSNQFKHYKDLDNVYNPAIIKEKKEICSKWHSGVSEFYLEKYFWKNDSLVLKEKYEEYWQDKGQLLITRLINGKYIVKEFVSCENKM
jgi:hypothetical protein